MQASRAAFTLLHVATVVGQHLGCCLRAPMLLAWYVPTHMRRPCRPGHDLTPSVADVLCRMQHLRSLLAPPRQHFPGGAACLLAWRQQVPVSPLPPQPPQPQPPPQNPWFQMALRSPPAVAPESSTRSCLYWAGPVPERARRYVCEPSPGPWRRALSSIWTALRCSLQTTAILTNC